MLRQEPKSTVLLMPAVGVCWNFVQGDRRLRKSSWMIPHVVRQKDDTHVVSWRCSWGNSCESGCYYAMARRERAPFEDALQIAAVASH